MNGRFIAIVGPSGVGKDSVMEALAARENRISLARRVITRPSDTGGEIHEGVRPEEFQSRKAAGEFVLSWSAHGLSYGIPRSVNQQLESGTDVLANLSRAVLPTAKERFEQFEVISLTADRHTLATRLAKRGRETADQIEGRLDRAAVSLYPNIAAHTIDNGGSLNQTVEAVLAKLYPKDAD